MGFGGRALNETIVARGPYWGLSGPAYSEDTWPGYRDDQRMALGDAVTVEFWRITRCAMAPRSAVVIGPPGKDEKRLERALEHAIANVARRREEIAMRLA